MTFRALLCGMTLAVSASGVHANEASGEYFFNHEHVLGTSFELRLNADSQHIATSAEHAALAEIDRLAKILSRHDRSSELMRWQSDPSDGQRSISDDLAYVLKRAEQWRELTAGAFDVRAGYLAESDSRPLATAPYTVSTSSESSVIQRHDHRAISLDGLAKGYIIDRVCEVLREQFSGIETFSVNIGGDVRKVGNHVLTVSVTNPFDSAVGAQPTSTFVSSQSEAIATSGNYRRFVQVDGTKHSHIVDPRTGSSADGVASATVIAPTSVDADAMATSLCVLSPPEGISLVDSIEAVECLIILTDGRKIFSQGWPDKPTDRDFQLVSGQNSKTEKSGLLVNFTLNRPEGGRYRRPYVAIWLEDAERYPVKTALLWMQTESPGPRWHRDLTRWYRNDRTRKLVEKSDLIGTISSATRGPGEYSARFDGTDNTGNLLPAGNYTLCIEVAREHGTYQIIRESVELGGTPIARKELENNVEMSAVSYEYLPDGRSEVAQTEPRPAENTALVDADHVVATTTVPTP